MRSCSRSSWLSPYDAARSSRAPKVARGDRHHLIPGPYTIQVLAKWYQPFPGYHLYDPSRRRSSPDFTVLVEALRDRG
jgi:hypothetical protein